MWGRKSFVFDNNLVKEVCKELGFGNPFDVTKLDSISKLPDILMQQDLAIVHLGEGKHKFIKGIDKVYHKFEPIQKSIRWPYRRSLLNQYNTSESNILSVANNHGILHHFLFVEGTEFDNVSILQRAKTYFPHRTKTTLEYSLGDEYFIRLRNVQIEIDLTIEYEGSVGIFEAKNGCPDNFYIC